MLKEFEEIFKPGCSTFKTPSVHMDVCPTIQPRYSRARSVPDSLRDKVEEQFQHLEAESIITAIDHFDCAFPVVPVLKADGKSVRICDDYKISINLSVSIHCPKWMIVLHPCKVEFSKLDFREAYNQMPVDEETTKLSGHQHTLKTVCVRTIVWRLEFCRLQHSSREEWNLQGIRGRSVYLDDDLVPGKTDAEHLQNLPKVY